MKTEEKELMQKLTQELNDARDAYEEARKKLKHAAAQINQCMVALEYEYYDTDRTKSIVFQGMQIISESRVSNAHEMTQIIDDLYRVLNITKQTLK